MTDKRVATIQDISCFGQCSITVALPVLSACGVETAIIPSAILSTHTTGFSGYTCHDLSADVPEIYAHWKTLGIRFDAVYTGYLGSTKLISDVRDIIVSLKETGCLAVVDPAMADDGVLYPAFDTDYVEAMKTLMSSADICLPNITEACMLTGVEYKTEYDEAYILTLIEKLRDLGPATVILTGVSYRPEKTGVVVYENGQLSYYEHDKLAKSCHGTGDVYASTFVGALMNGSDSVSAAKIAADFTVTCIEETQDDESHWYGVKFEKALPSLIQTLHETRTDKAQ